jgi:hypothetical protein
MDYSPISGAVFFARGENRCKLIRRSACSHLRVVCILSEPKSKYADAAVSVIECQYPINEKQDQVGESEIIVPMQADRFGPLGEFVTQVPDRPTNKRKFASDSRGIFAGQQLPDHSKGILFQHNTTWNEARSHGPLAGEFQLLPSRAQNEVGIRTEKTKATSILPCQGAIQKPRIGVVPNRLKEIYGVSANRNIQTRDRCFQVRHRQ